MSTCLSHVNATNDRFARNSFKIEFVFYRAKGVDAVYYYNNSVYITDAYFAGPQNKEVYTIYYY